MGRVVAHQRRGSDATMCDVLRSYGEGPQTVGEHDRYEPTIVSRVYFLLDREACQIKIGYTEVSVAERQAAHERRRGHRLELLGTMAGGYDLERAMHGRFRDYRVEAQEWYSSEIIGELAPLLAA